MNSHCFVHSTAEIDAGAKIGAGTKVWHWTHVCQNATIGRDCVLGQNVYIGPNVVVGDRCKIQNNVSVYAGVHLDTEVFCGPSVVFTNVLNPRGGIEKKDSFLATKVNRGATLGANSTIVCGHTLDRFAFVAAGAVVTADVPAYALVAGVPARRIGWVSEYGERLEFTGDVEGEAICPATGQVYELGNDRVWKRK